MSEDVKITRGGLTIPPKLLAWLASIAIGAALGGGGVSFAASSTASDELIEAKQEISRGIQALGGKVDALTSSVIELRAEAKRGAHDQQRLERLLEDHEQRLRALEIKRR